LALIEFIYLLTCLYLYTAAAYTEKPEQQRFTNRTGVLTKISSRRHSAFSGRPLPE